MLKYNTTQLHIYHRILILVLAFLCLYYMCAYTDDGGFGGFFVSFIIYSHQHLLF